MKPTRRYRALAIVGAAVLVGLAADVGTAGASATNGLRGQTKTSLTRTNRDCGGNLIAPSAETIGSATMNETRSPANGSAPNLSAGLSIRGATAGATYAIRLIQVDDNASAVGDSCATVLGTVTVDEFGNGTASVGARVLPGATHWWVDLNNQAYPPDFLDTDLVSIA
jgi:hypothetical protein